MHTRTSPPMIRLAHVAAYATSIIEARSAAYACRESRYCKCSTSARITRVLMDAEGVGTRCRRRVAAERRTVSDNDSPTPLPSLQPTPVCVGSVRQGPQFVQSNLRVMTVT